MHYETWAERHTCVCKAHEKESLKQLHQFSPPQTNIDTVDKNQPTEYIYCKQVTEEAF